MMVMISPTINSKEWLHWSQNGNTENLKNWHDVYEKVLMSRLQSRYLSPLSRIHKMGKNQGEGFAAVTIQCALIEFLAALEEGKVFVHSKPDKGANEYNKSGQLFEDFLHSAKPFNKYFDTKSAHDFYTNVRCALLHEAQTKNGWKIRSASASKTGAVNTRKKEVFRELLTKEINAYLASYKKRLLKDAKTQTDFKRKFDHLCRA